MGSLPAQEMRREASLMVVMRRVGKCNRRDLADPLPRRASEGYPAPARARVDRSVAEPRRCRGSPSLARRANGESRISIIRDHLAIVAMNQESQDIRIQRLD